MNKKFVNDELFTHCLRIQVFPDEYSQERIDSVKEFCLKYGFKNVIMMFNGECFNVGHISTEDLKPLATIAKNYKGEYIKTNHQAIYPYLYKQDDRRVLILVNANVDNYKDICFEANGFDFKSIQMINRDGSTSNVEFTKENNKVTINKPLEYMSTLTFLLK